MDNNGGGHYALNNIPTGGRNAALNIPAGGANARSPRNLKAPSPMKKVCSPKVKVDDDDGEKLCRICYLGEDEEAEELIV